MNVGLNHVAVYVCNLERAKEYYIKYFGGRSGELYEAHGFSSYFITFNNGARLEIMHDVKLKAAQPDEYASGWSHIAFSVGNRQEVLDITERIVSDGYKLYSAPRETGDGYFESCVADPDGNRVEITI